MKTYLVTGAAGFIGANYLKYILNMTEKRKFLIQKKTFLIHYQFMEKQN